MQNARHNYYNQYIYIYIYIYINIYIYIYIYKRKNDNNKEATFYEKIYRDYKIEKKK